MKNILIDSEMHYAFRFVNEHEVEMLVFPSDCPGMGHREPYSLDEGKTAYLFWLGERVCFDYGRSTLTHPDGRQETFRGPRFRMSIAREMADEMIVCGDDLRYRLSDTGTYLA